MTDCQLFPGQYQLKSYLIVQIVYFSTNLQTKISHSVPLSVWLIMGSLLTAVDIQIMCLCDNNIITIVQCIDVSMCLHVW